MENKRPTPVVGALIFNPKGKLLLTKAVKWDGYYTIPGGHIEFKETMKEALRREVKEETNLDIFDINFLCVKDCILPKNYHRKKHFLLLDFVCKSKSSRVELNDESKDFKWVSIDNLEKIRIEENTMEAIEEYKSKHGLK